MREVVFITSIVLSILEIWLSIKLILRKKNNYAQTSEILLSFVVQSLYLEALHVNWWKIIVCILVQYIGVKFFLLIFMIIIREGSFYIIKRLAKEYNRLADQYGFEEFQKFEKREVSSIAFERYYKNTLN